MDDQEIIARFFARDEEGLTAARARYEPYCAAVARSLLNDPRDQEECLSDTWLRAWNSIPPQRPRSLGAFLAKITRNLAINRLRDGNAQRRGGGQVPLALEELGECVSPRAPRRGSWTARRRWRPWTASWTDCRPFRGRYFSGGTGIWILLRTSPAAPAGPKAG